MWGIRKHSEFVLLCFSIIERMKRNRICFVALPLLVCLLAWAGCGEIRLIDDESETAPDTTSTSTEGVLQGDTLLAVNDTAKFYLSGIEIHNILLSFFPSPATLVKDPRYRLPTNLEVSQVLKNVDIPQGFWKSKQRILCYDHPKDEGIKMGSTLFGSGEYYTYTPHGIVTKAGFQTKYCILPIRSESLSKATEHTVIESMTNGKIECAFVYL